MLCGLKKQELLRVFLPFITHELQQKCNKIEKNMKNFKFVALLLLFGLYNVRAG